MSIDLIHQIISDKLSGANGPDFLLYREVGSTNDVCKDLLKGNITDGCYGSMYNQENIQEGFTVISLSQSKGKGRSGRKFFSPPECSVYLSMILKPMVSFDETLLITPMAAAAVHDAIKDVCNVDTGIKWVNDLYYNDRKICGILTEASVSSGGTIDYAVLGIGINLYSPKCDIPEDIKDVYGTIFPKEVLYNEKIVGELAAEIIIRTLKYYKNIQQRSFINTYRDAMFLIGKEVTYISGENEHTVTVVDVDDNAHLLVVDKNGEKHSFSDGEVRLKILRN